MKTVKEMIEVMQAYDRGEDIEYHLDGEWYYAQYPAWAWSSCDYRVKRKLKTIWVNEYSDDEFVIHKSKEKAESNASHACRPAIRVAVKYQEVEE